jgi:protein-S-isoprenylcysteine O-methyltransferase Ste14
MAVTVFWLILGTAAVYRHLWLLLPVCAFWLVRTAFILRTRAHT